MSFSLKNRFRPTLESLEAREVLSTTFGSGPFAEAAQVRHQAGNEMRVDHNRALNNAANNLAAQQVTVVNGVADITQAARTTLESDILSRLPQSLGSYPLVGEVTRDKVTLNRLTLDKDGNFNGQLTVTFKYQMLGSPQTADVKATITNNRLSLDSDNALVRQFGKLEQRAAEWQPHVDTALDALRSRLMPLYFGAQAGSVNGR